MPRDWEVYGVEDVGAASPEWEGAPIVDCLGEVIAASSFPSYDAPPMPPVEFPFAF